MACLDDDTICAFVEGQLHESESAEVEAHLDRCRACRQLLSRVARAIVAKSEPWPGRTDTETTARADPTIDIESRLGIDRDQPLTEAGPARGGNARFSAAQSSPMEQAVLLERGAMVDHFKVKRLLGRGGMGDVYLATDTRLGRRVALKLIRPHEVLPAQPMVDRFLFEARATARFNHPHIVTVYALGQHRGQPYLALEYLEGGTLRDRIGPGPLSALEAARIGRAVARALAEAHRNRILHLDLKPSNILLPRDGRPRVVDFGLARALAAPTTSQPTDGIDQAPDAELGLPHPALTRGHSRRGTPAYMAPEQWRGENTTEATDVWALGLVLWQAIVGRHPYDMCTTQQIASQVRSPQPLPAVESSSGAPAVLAALIARCVAKAPEDRPKTDEIIATLGKLLDRRDSKTAPADRSPFRGLFPFDEHHAAVFFGREAEVDALAESLRQHPVAAVVGPSGCGKSSFVQAGLVPRLREQGNWTVLRMRPGPDPFSALARTLLDSAPVGDPLDPAGPDDGRHTPNDLPQTERRRDQLAIDLANSPPLLMQRLLQIAESQRCKVLLFVDQLEELCTVAHDETLRRRFIASVQQAADDVGDPVRVVLAARDDFLYRLAESSATHTLASHVMLLRRPGDEMLRAMLTGPVSVADYRYDDEQLVDDMVANVRGEFSCLPLLQFAASKLWEGRDPERRLLRRSTYAAIGGVAGALANHADGLIESLAPANRSLVRRLLLRLVTPEGNRKPLTRKEVLAGLPDGASTVLDRLIKARLVAVRQVFGEDLPSPELELVHESLVTAWRRLARWIDEGREELRFLADVDQAAHLWQRRGKRDAELWQGAALDEAQRALERCTAELPERAALFLAAGRRRSQRASRRKQLVTGLAFMVLVIIAVAFAAKEHEASEQKTRADKERYEAERQRADAQQEGARAAFARGDVLAARAKVRGALTTRDTSLARLLWWRLSADPLVWKKKLRAFAHGVEISPDGRTLAVACADRSVYLLDATTRSLIRVLRGHKKAAYAVTFSPDGRSLATGSTDGQVLLWTVASGRSIRAPFRHPTTVWDLAFSPDGKTLASNGFGGKVFLWDVASDKAKRLEPGPAILLFGAAFDPTGKTLATGARDGKIRLWDTTTRQQSGLLLGHEKAVIAVGYSPDGKLLASGGPAGRVRLWDARAGVQRRSWIADTSRINRLAFSPDGHTIATVGNDGKVKLWNSHDGEQRRLFSGHQSAGFDLGFSPDGRQLVSASTDKTVRLWQVDVTPRKAFDSPPTDNVSVVDFHPDGKTLASGALDGTMRLWDVHTGRQKRIISSPKGDMWSMRFSPDGTKVATGHGDSSVRLWDVQTGRQTATLHGHRSIVFTVAFSPDGKTLATGSSDYDARLWVVKSGKPLHRLTGHIAVVTEVAFSPDGKTLATGSHDNTIRLWQVRSGRLMRVLKGHSKTVKGLAFTPDGRSLVSGSADKSLRLWDLASGTSRVVGTHGSGINRFDIHPDGKRVGTPSEDHTARIWDLRDGRFTELRGHRQALNCLVFSPDGRLIATAGSDATARLWHTDSGRPYWHAPALLARGPRLITSRGPIDLEPNDGTSKTTRRPTSWQNALQQRARLAAQGPSDALLCMSDFDHQLELWDTTADQRLFAKKLPDVKQLWAVPSGCVAHAGEKAVLFDRKGGPTPFPVEKVTTVSWAPPNVLIAAKGGVTAYSLGGIKNASISAQSSGVTTLATAHGSLVLGYADGNISVTTIVGNKKTPATSFEDVPASPVVRMIAGPMKSLIVGYANGLVGLWDLRTGRRLDRTYLHGPVVHLLRDRAKLFAATELGDHLVWDLGVLSEDYCGLLRRIWQAVPVLWHDGVAVARPPPRDHACASKTW